MAIYLKTPFENRIQLININILRKDEDDYVMTFVENKFRVSKQKFYLKKSCLEYGNYDKILFTVTLRLVGGKGGFQTTLRNEANHKKKFVSSNKCRMLDGRRVIDAKDEIRMKKWLKQ